MLYSKKTNGFYDESIHGKKVPKDVVSISGSAHANMIAGQSEGMHISSDENGYPILVDRPSPTQEELDANRVNEIDARLKQIDAESVRPLRAINNGTDTQVDRDRLAELDSEAETLRVERSTLV